MTDVFAGRKVKTRVTHERNQGNLGNLPILDSCCGLKCCGNGEDVLACTALQRCKVTLIFFGWRTLRDVHVHCP